MTSRTKKNLNTLNEGKVAATGKKLQAAGQAKGGPGTWSNSRPGTGLKKRA